MVWKKVYRFLFFSIFPSHSSHSALACGNGARHSSDSSFSRFNHVCLVALHAAFVRTNATSYRVIEQRQKAARNAKIPCRVK